MMTSPRRDTGGFQPLKIIETEAYRQIRSAIDDGVSPILVTGNAGIGKTTLMQYLQQEWEASGGTACFVPLSTTQSEGDLLDAIRSRFNSNSESKQELIIKSSADELAQSLVNFVNSQEQRLLILLDSLDSTFNPGAVLRVVRLLVEQSRAIVVVTERPTAPQRNTEYLRWHRVTLAPWSKADVSRLLAGLNPEIASTPSADKLYEVIDGNPLFAALVGSLQKHQFEEGLSNLFSSPEKTLRALVVQILTRESHRQNIEFKSLVTLLARVAIRRSAKLSDLPITPREAAIIQNTPFVREIDEQSVSIVHVALAWEIVALAADLPQKQALLSDLDVGAEEAERDVQLESHFVSLPGVEDLRTGRKNIVVGDRGTGKSALFVSLARITSAQQDKIQVLQLADPADLMLRLESGGGKLENAEQFRAAWLLSVACCLAANLNLKSTKQQVLAACLQSALNNAAPRIGLVAKMIAVGHRVLRTSVKFQWGPVVLEPAKAGEKIQRGSRPIDIEAFLGETASILKTSGRRVIIAVDRIDEVYKYSRDIQESLVQGLFLAESSLSKIPEIGLLVFIRTDLFQTYDIQEKNKLLSRTLHLRWERNALLRMIALRIFANPSLARLSEIAEGSDDYKLDCALRCLFPEFVEGEPFKEWLWRHLENGNGHVSPRQLILLLVLAKDATRASQQAFDGLPIFRENFLRQAMSQLSELCFDEIVSDFRVGTTFLRNCRAGKLEAFHLAEVEQLFDTNEGSMTSQVELLQKLGVLERIVIEDAPGKQAAKIRIPPLYRRCWIAAS